MSDKSTTQPDAAQQQRDDDLRAAIEKAQEQGQELLESRMGTGEPPEWVNKLSEQGVGGTANEGGSTADTSADITLGTTDSVGGVGAAPMGTDTESNAPPAA